MSYCRATLDSKDMFLNQHGAGRYPPCEKSTISFGHMVHGRKGQNLLLAVTTETQRQVHRLNDIYETVTEWRGRQGRG